MIVEVPASSQPAPSYEVMKEREKSKITRLSLRRRKKSLKIRRERRENKVATITRDPRSQRKKMSMDFAENPQKRNGSKYLVGV